MQSKELTKAEEQVMQYIWKIDKGFLKDIVGQYPEPKPAYTTISTVIRVLVKKQFIDYNTYGKIYEYFPLVTKNKYFRSHINSIIRNFYNGSMSNFTSFFTSGKELNITELEEIKKIIEKKIEKKKTKI